jgi:transcriptional regulator of acetoin/glycerol metabolism
MLGLAREQITVQRGGQSLSLPDADDPSSVLVLYDVDRLTPDEQCRLLAWLDEHLAAQVISTCREPLTPLIDAGVFLANLYYRLNTVLITLD